MRRCICALSFVALLGSSWLSPGSVSAQINPFEEADAAGEEETEAKPEPKKTGKNKKKDEEAEKRKAEEEAAAKEAEEEAAAEAARAAEAAKAAEEAEAAATQRAAANAEAEAAATAEAAEVRESLEGVPGAARVELTENYAPLELITTGIVLPAGLALAVAGYSIFGEPAASMTTPTIGSLDYRLSIASHGDLREGTPFLFGAFDVAGVALPALVGSFYLVSGLYFWAADEPLLASQSVNIDHAMVGMAQTIGWTAFAAGMTHLLVGRQRPYAAFGRTAYGDPDEGGANGSFFSTTTALSFATASFAARDYSAYARARGANFLVGTALPYTVLYGLSTLIGYSSIYGQQHYFSDVAVGALVGSLIGHLSWTAHFERDGTPRRRFSAAAEARVVPLVAPSEDGVSAGLGVTGRF